MLKPATQNVAAFVAMVNADASVQRPVGTLSIGCHGHPYGILEIPLDSSSGQNSYINDVTRVETSHALEITTAATFPRPLDPIFHFPIPPIFRIVGCSIGAARPFLTHLRKALGNIFIIVATQHEDAQKRLTITRDGIPAEGVWRFLVYDFRVNTPDFLEGKEDIVEAFDNKHLTFVDGKPIPRSFWKERIPTDVFELTRTSSNVNIVLNPKINGVSELQPDSNRWEHIWEPVGPWKITPPAHNLPTTTERREFMRDQIRTRPEFAAGHPFPLHEQRRYATYDAFIDGYDWLAEPKSDDHWAGHRNVYRVGAAITIPSDGNVLAYDWVDTTNTFTHFGLSETNDRLFVRI